MNTVHADGVDAYVVDEVPDGEPRGSAFAPAGPVITVDDRSLRPAQLLIASATIWLPFLGAVAAVLWALRYGVGRVEVLTCVAGFVLTNLGIEFGMHRALAHRAFDTHRWVKVVFAILGSMAVEGRLLYWVASHRRHHAHSDTENDPHSPHVRRYDGKVEGLGLVRGLWHAHIGHMVTDQVTNCSLFGRDINRDPALRRISALYGWIVLAGLVIPAAVGFAAYGTAAGAFSCFLWGGPLRIFLVHHTTWSVASMCHRFGGIRFRTGDKSRNNHWLALPSFGSAWQNNHHAFPSSAYLGLRWWELDMTGIVIRGMATFGLVWHVRRPTTEQIERQLAARS